MSQNVRFPGKWAHSTMGLMLRIDFFVLAACCTVIIGCHSNTNTAPLTLVCEVRIQKSASPDPKTTRFSLVSSSSEEGHYLWGYNQKEQKEEAGFFIFQPDEFLVHAEREGRRALIIRDESHPNPAQVFRLSLPGSPKPTGWSAWQRADFLATGDVGWSLIYNQKVSGFSTHVPPDSFEVRYKIAK